MSETNQSNQTIDSEMGNVQEKKEIETIKIPTKFSYKMIDEEMKKIELEKNIILRLIKSDGKLFIDLRKYYKNYPTKRGIRIPYDTFMEATKYLQNY